MNNTWNCPLCALKSIQIYLKALSEFYRKWNKKELIEIWCDIAEKSMSRFFSTFCMILGKYLNLRLNFLIWRIIRITLSYWIFLQRLSDISHIKPQAQCLHIECTTSTLVLFRFHFLCWNHWHRACDFSTTCNSIQLLESENVRGGTVFWSCCTVFPWWLGPGLIHPFVVCNALH